MVSGKSAYAAREVVFVTSGPKEGEFSPGATGETASEWRPGKEADTTRRIRMETEQFDRLVRGLARSRSRRSAMLGLLGGA